MYRFRQEPTGQIREKLKKIDDKIKSEKDSYIKMKLQEQKLMIHLFDNIYSPY